jgi:tRNA(His) 5'-end guanylyltransferase
MGLPSRMKEYERTVDIHLIKKLPVIIRLDGKAFHTFCRGLKKPWDQRLNDIMVNTTITLCKEIQGAQIGYTQSDEITILITDFENLRPEEIKKYILEYINLEKANVY